MTLIAVTGTRQAFVDWARENDIDRVTLTKGDTRYVFVHSFASAQGIRPDDTIVLHGADAALVSYLYGREISR